MDIFFCVLPFYVCFSKREGERGREKKNRKLQEIRRLQGSSRNKQREAAVVVDGVCCGLRKKNYYKKERIKIRTLL